MARKHINKPIESESEQEEYDQSEQEYDESEEEEFDENEQSETENVIVFKVIFNVRLMASFRKKKTKVK
jgi:hypothetical protein